MRKTVFQNIGLKHPDEILEEYAKDLREEWEKFMLKATAGSDKVEFSIRKIRTI